MPLKIIRGVLMIVWCVAFVWLWLGFMVHPLWFVATAFTFFVAFDCTRMVRRVVRTQDLHRVPPSLPADGVVLLCLALLWTQTTVYLGVGVLANEWLWLAAAAGVGTAAAACTWIARIALLPHR